MASIFCFIVLIVLNSSEIMASIRDIWSGGMGEAGGVGKTGDGVLVRGLGVVEGVVDWCKYQHCSSLRPHCLMLIARSDAAGVVHFFLLHYLVFACELQVTRLTFKIDYFGLVSLHLLGVYKPALFTICAVGEFIALPFCVLLLPMDHHAVEVRKLQCAVVAT